MELCADVIKGFPFLLKLSRKIGKQMYFRVLIGEIRALHSFTKNPVPVIKELDKEGSRKSSRNATARWHSMCAFHYIGGCDLSEA